MNLRPQTELGMSGRIFAVVAIAALAHLSVRGIRYPGEHLLSVDALVRWNKVRTLAGLITSTEMFSLYFGALGIVLNEFGVSLTTYLASA